MSADADTTNDEEYSEPTPDEAEALRIRHLVRRFWASARGFWGREGERIAWILTIGLLILLVLELIISFSINRWNRVFFDALENRDAATAWAQRLLFPVLAAISVSLGMIEVYGRMTLQRRWREWLNDHVVDAWLANGRYYQLNLVEGDHKNPEYRIADDLRIATDAPVDFVVGVASAAMSAATFIVVLWTIGGSYS